MDNLSERLISCFSLVFPNLSTDAIRAASADRLSAWDSLAQVNLLSVIHEEFGVDIDFDQFADAISFSSLLDHLRTLSTRS